MVDAPEKADAVIFNTCSVRQHAEDKVWSEVGRVAKLNKGSRRKRLIGLVGCMAQNYQDRIFERAPDVDFLTGPQDIHKIPGIIATLSAIDHRLSTHALMERKIWETEGERRPEEIYHTGFHEDKRHAFVVISEGCSNFCSYCVVPFVRGPLRNRKYKDILREIQDALEAGITSITLLGQNVNAYRDKETSFINLIEMVNAIPGLREFSFVTSHPRDTTLELFRAMASLEKLKKYLHLPVQSGSDKVLALMNRGYTRKFYFDLAENFRRIVPGGALTSDIIVGCPQETEEDFQDTLELVRRIEFEAAYIFKYSPRMHTEAAKLFDSVEKKEKERRHALVLELQKSISKRKKCLLP